MCALSLYFAQNFLKKAKKNIPEMAGNVKSYWNVVEHYQE